MRNSPWYNRQGEPVEPAEWSRLHEKEKYRRVGLTHIGDVEISTVWLGIDMAFMSSGPPIIYETMIFGGPLDGNTWRYATEDEAIRGHEEAVRLASAEPWESGEDAARYDPNEQAGAE